MRLCFHGKWIINWFLSYLLLVANVNKSKNNFLKENKTGFSVLTLNLHTYQEKDQKNKFNVIVDFVDSEDLDVICFQECAQHKRSKFVSENNHIREDNMAYIILKKLSQRRKNYYYCWDWAHYSCRVWEEGVAIVSRYPLTGIESRYVSSSKSKTDPLGSRKALFAQTCIPNIGKLNIFSVHLSWESKGLLNQIAHLISFVTEKEDEDVGGTVICGDFNDEPTGKGYKQMVDAGFIDSYRSANPEEISEKTTIDDKRIDYIFFKSEEGFLMVSESQVVFNGYNQRIVSDHYGVVTKFRAIP